MNQSLAESFGLSQYALQKNLEGISQEDSLQAPKEGGNCINWVAGHLLTSRESLLKKLGGVSFLSEEEGKAYQRGSESLKAGDSSVDISKLSEGLIKTGESLKNALKNLPLEKLGEAIDASSFPMPVEHPTLGTLLSIFLFHEGYHGGQVGVLRRSLGKSGVLT